MNNYDRKLSLATVVIRIAWVAWGIIIAAFFTYNYQLSVRTFESEVERNFEKSTQIVRLRMEAQLQAIEMAQDITAKSRTLVGLLSEEDIQAVDNYMLELSEFDSELTTDLNFFYRYGDIVWEDGQSEPFGVSNEQLLSLAQAVDFNHSWYFFSPNDRFGSQHIMLRRSAFVDEVTGEIVGYSYVGLVLDNSLDLLKEIGKEANVKEIMLVKGQQVIASSSVNTFEMLKTQSLVRDDDELSGELAVMVGGMPAPVSIVFTQENTKIEAIERNLATSVVLALFAITVAAIWLTRVIQKRIKDEIAGVMALADNFSEPGAAGQFEGSAVLEFDQLGRALQTSIRREQEKEKSFRDLFEYSLLPTILLDQEQNILDMNPAARNKFRDPESLESLKQSLFEHLGHAFNLSEHTELNTNVNGIDFRWSLSPIQVDGRQPSMVVQGQNITKFVQAKQQSELARQEAENTAAARAEFLAKVSHEIRTPLNGIIGISQLLKQELENTEQIKQVNVLYQSSENLLNLLNGVLDFSRIDKGLMKLEMIEFSLSQFWETITSFTEPGCRHKGLFFKEQLNLNQDVLVKSDQLRLTQVLVNLISNATKFTSDGGITIELGLRNQLADRAELYFFVQDTGIGIAADKQEQIFASFTQADISISRKYGGSGLGLAIVDNLVKLFNGRIEVDSQLAKGARFEVSIPIEIVTRNSAQTGIVQNETVWSSGLRLLLVEDNRTNAFIVQLLTKKHGVHLDWALDGEQGIEMATTNTYDLILMDNQMPNMDGIEATRLLREKYGISTPVIACTADGHYQTSEAFIKAGADAVIVKPIMEEKLIGVVSQVLSGASKLG